MRRVVVTGLGMISPAGANVAASWGNILKSKSGIKQIPPSLLDTSDLATKIAGFIPDNDPEFGFNLEDYLCISFKDILVLLFLLSYCPFIIFTD